jgi:hypothetical protein
MDGVPGNDINIRVVQQVSEPAGRLQVLVVTVRTDSFGTFNGVSLSKSFSLRVRE